MNVQNDIAVTEKPIRADDMLALMRSKVRRRLPSVEFVTGAFREHVYISDDEGRVGQVVVSFSFPGQRYGEGSLRWDAAPNFGPNRHLPPEPFGPPAPRFMCCNGDKEAFEAFLISPPTPSPSTRG